MSISFSDLLGIIGCLLILFAFYRTSIGRWTGRSLWYELDNFLGAFCLIVYSYDKRAFVNIVLNAVWLLVALRGLSSIAERRRRVGARRK